MLQRPPEGQAPHSAEAGGDILHWRKHQEKLYLNFVGRDLTTANSTITVKIYKLLAKGAASDSSLAKQEAVYVNSSHACVNSSEKMELQLLGLEKSNLNLTII